MDDLLDYVLKLSSRGFVCVPLTPGGRHLDFPAMGLNPVHLTSRRKDLKELAFGGVAFSLAQHPPDDATIREWFERHKGNLGIVGGAADLVILDFDSLPALRWWRNRNAALFSSTPVARTPKGFHVYLRCRLPRVSSSLHTGLRRAGHIKALGGYVVSSPSLLNDGSTYRWLEGQSLLELEPQYVDMESLSVHPTSPLKRYYDHLLGRGYFEPS